MNCIKNYKKKRIINSSSEKSGYYKVLLIIKLSAFSKVILSLQPKQKYGNYGVKKVEWTPPENWHKNTAAAWFLVAFCIVTGSLFLSNYIFCWHCIKQNGAVDKIDWRAQVGVESLESFYYLEWDATTYYSCILNNSKICRTQILV